MLAIHIAFFFLMNVSDNIFANNIIIVILVAINIASKKIDSLKHYIFSRLK